MAKEFERYPSEGDEEEIQVLTLEFEDDTTMECGVVAIFTIEDQDYIAVAEVDEDGNFVGEDDELEVLLYRYYEDLEEEDSFTIEDIDDEDELEMAGEVLGRIMNDEFEEDEDGNMILQDEDEEDEEDAMVQSILNRIIRDKKY